LLKKLQCAKAFYTEVERRINTDRFRILQVWTEIKKAAKLQKAFFIIADQDFSD